MADSNETMRVGLFMQPAHHPRENPTLALERDLQLIEHLDTLGFDEAWIGEHHSTGWETIASPDIFIMAAAARTRHIKLGSGVVPLALHHPLLVADNYVLLDHLTRGRVMLGMGPGGGLPSDPYVFGLDGETQHRRYVATLDAVAQLLTSTEPLSLETEWFTLRDAVLQLRPYTHPHMPLALVTGTNRDTLERIGRYGTRWFVGTSPDKFDEAWEIVERSAQEVGRVAERSNAYLPVTMHLAESREQALDDIRAGAARERYDFSSPVTGAPLPDIPREAWAEHLAERPTSLIGTPGDALEKIRALRAKTGAGGLLIASKEWASREAIWKSYELFARFVMPELRGSLEGLKKAEAVARQLVKQRS